MRVLHAFANVITGTLPICLGGGSGLQDLQLGRNRYVRPIPDEIWDLSLLAMLDISSNGLTGTLPAAVSNARALGFLILHENKFEGSLPSEIGQLNPGIDIAAQLTYERFLARGGFVRV